MSQFTPHIIAISGPSLSGKTEFAKRLNQLGAVELVSHTTRPSRLGEVDGVNYNFVNKATFAELDKNNCMVQKSFLNNEFYGMSLEEIVKKADSNKPLIWVVAPQSVPQIEDFIEKQHPDWKLTKCLIFNDPEVLVHRLLTRFENDTHADKEHYAKRFLNLISTEIPQWMSKEAIANSDFAVPAFSEQTETNVLVDFLNLESIQKTHPEFCKNALITLQKNKITP